MLLTHYPMISFAEKVSSASLIYGDDLEDLEEVARPLLERSAPTIVVNGHIHLRHACMAGALLQVSCAALVEPPCEITLLDFETDPEPEGDRVEVRRRSIPLVSSSVARPCRPRNKEWTFEAGTWRTVRATKPRKEAHRYKKAEMGSRG